MKIFISHSTKTNFEEELYIPLQNSELNGIHEFVFPRENGQEIVIKDVIRDCDLVLAECSNPTFEQGLELGWASGAYVTVICFYKTGTELPKDIQQVSDSVNEYTTVADMIQKVKEVADTL
ncbi:MAG: hypothetical protein H0W89_06305 [Candidatus Levybacteria bacterium]|nr:hypothetical protein [Candidatus Levybacteria bacterium]